MQVGAGLQVDGTAHLAGQVTLLAPEEGHAVGEREHLLSAAAIHGRFDRVAYGSVFFWTAALE